MSAVRIPVLSVRAVDPGFYDARHCLFVEVDMTEGQMLSAIKSMLAQVPSETWAQWVAQINGEVVS